MKQLSRLTLLFCVLLTVGCGSLKPPSNGDSSRPFDAAPREGWATDPNYSYRVYSYYPVNFNPGGFFGYGQTSRVWTGQPFP